LSFGNRCAGPSSQNQAGRAGERQRHMTGKSVGGRHRQQGTNRVKPRPSLNVTGIVRDVPTGSRRILMVVA
jgi:hypothetical protein